MINLKTSLFKKDSKSKIRYLTISTENDIIVQESGLLNTDSPVIHRKAAKGKNIGKSNETTAVDQAMIEFKSIVASKIKEGYSTTIEEAKIKVIILPMLAKSYKDEKSKIDWNKDVYTQQKYDGMRCLMVISNGEITLLSRDGRNIMDSSNNSMKHIITEFSKIKEDVILDGELYINPDYSFQETMKAIKSKNKNNSLVNYYIYDCVLDKPFIDRITYAENLVFKYLGETLETAFISRPLKTDNTLAWHKEFIKDGYEGSMIRHSDVGYELNKRSSSLLKYKDFLDTDAIIIDIIPADQRPEWGVPVLKYADTSLTQDTFKAGLKFSHKDREDLLTNKHLYIGKTANIRFFEYTDSGVPRFPVMIGIHEDR
jgi:DNA ligase-1